MSTVNSHTYAKTRHPLRIPGLYRERVSLGRSGAVLLDLCGLTVALTQVVELCAAHVALGHDLDLVDRGCVQGEGTLNTDTEGNLADGESFVNTVATACDNNALENLDT